MEIIFSVPKGEEKYVYKFKEIMEDTYDVIKCVPMEASVEVSTTNWAEKVDMNEIEYLKIEPMKEESGK